MYRKQFWIEWNNSLDSEYQNDYKMSTCININAKIKIIHQVSLKIMSVLIFFKGELYIRLQGNDNI